DMARRAVVSIESVDAATASLLWAACRPVPDADGVRQALDAGADLASASQLALSQRVAPLLWRALHGIDAVEGRLGDAPVPRRVAVQGARLSGAAPGRGTGVETARLGGADTARVQGWRPRRPVSRRGLAAHGRRRSRASARTARRRCVDARAGRLVGRSRSPGHAP